MDVNSYSKHVYSSLTAICRGETVDVNDDELESNSKLRGLLNSHKLLGRTLSPERTANRHRNIFLLGEMQRLSFECKNRGFAITGLKGIALLKSTYPDLGTRSLSDIDVLILPDKLQDIKNVLESLQYKIVSSKTWKGNDFKLVAHKIDGPGSTIEVHSKLFMNEPEGFKWHFMNSAEGFQTLTPTDQLIHLCGHYGYQHNFIKLFWLVDIAEFLKQNISKICWPEFLERSKQLKIFKANVVCLHIAHRFLAAPLVSEVPKGDRKLLRLLSWPFLVNTRDWPARYLLIKHLKSDHIVDALKYDWAWLKHKLPSFDS